MPFPEGSTPQHSQTPEGRTRATHTDARNAPGNAERDTSHNRLQRAIRQYRQEQRLTHEGIAKRLRTTPDYIASIEQGTVDPPLSYLLKLAEAMDAEIDFSFRPKEAQDMPRQHARRSVRP